MTQVPNMEEILQELRKLRVEYARQQTVGERFLVPRMGKRGVEVILYRPQKQNLGQKLPVLFNMHGGAWVGGDAVLMDGFCAKLANEIPAFIVNVNYTKADVEPMPYALEEVCDVVEYFSRYAEEYGIDANRMAVGGHSAGGQLAAAGALALKERGIQLACQMLVYPATDVTQKDVNEWIPYVFPGETGRLAYCSPLLVETEKLVGLCPAVFIICGVDLLRKQGIDYAKRLMDLAVPVKVKEYPKAVHGFVEVYRPDSGADLQSAADQVQFCEDADWYLIQELRACFAEKRI